MKYEIDLLKLGNHGGGVSNTLDYLNVLSPDYIIISNEIGNPDKITIFYLEEKGINYLYTVQDEYEISTIIYNDEMSLGFGTERIKK